MFANRGHELGKLAKLDLRIWGLTPDAQV